MTKESSQLPIQNSAYAGGLPLWLNMYEVAAWVLYRDPTIVAKASDWQGLAAQRLFGETKDVADFENLRLALQAGKLIAQGALGGQLFSPIQPGEWTRLRVAPLDLAHQFPYVAIQVRRDDALAAFPPISKNESAVDQSPPKRPPPDDQIVAKMHELIGKGMTRDEAAKRIRNEPGFERVTNVLARELVTGTLPLGRPKKASQK